ncbi:tRNA (5-methylaminomethyl-2-thiouridine)(34)-methyltransferase MnmD [Caulobacter sp. UNC279MFTsu5.1]|uniref:tRNA (5-methylaminomethyl-2-thiouridine)(34)-methyltransferase MnmD n=1 Tax=Caulobacter sp. UNC279MFTsu5.1 TaxID=1502775 RepID=UPI0008F13D1B|nr:tRNA (5-methylaminomethyl-2-thiouridine)(34)-methyltransferase MnmD [Caulobacter sp. UNC279MFTsu5.1]SFI86274.1 tRNA 5-methylaminomethyl-2-thiouridine biosynthesis bifunctional protein [Caulobacter sp. UNC279MFTsu5.1]
MSAPAAPPPDAPSASPLVWRDDGLPQSALYGDVYFSSADGLAETRAVFLAGCGLPAAWRGRDRFVIGELGFGTGLNIAALLDLWRREKTPQSKQGGQRLHVFSIEAHPITRDEAARALAVWPELGEAAQVLLDHWPGRARGFHRIDLPGFDATFDLAVMDVEDALAAWDGAADAWFLDGFSPALNPAMWREAVLAAVAARSAPGARAATFTVAGAVRRGLAAAGFQVDKRPGFGRKKERLEAVAPGVATAPPRPRRLAVVGGGIAGAAMARAARAEGLAVTVFDDDQAPASGNPAALVTPALDAGGGPRAALPAQAFARAVALYAQLPQAVIARGVLKLPVGPRDGERHAAVAAQDLFEPGAMALPDPEAVAARLGEPAAGPALDMVDALVVEPARVIEAWRGSAIAARVARLARENGVWRLFDPDDRLLAEAEAVVLAGGADLARLWPAAPIRPVRGQATWTDRPAPAPAAFGAYAVPTRDGVLFGATHDRGDVATEAREADDRRNLQTLAKGLPGLAARLADAPLRGRAAVRATTADHLPLAGAVPGAPDGLFVLGGLGGRGFCLAPLLAEHLTARILALPSPLPRPLSDLLEPSRFPSRAAPGAV